MIRGCGVWDTHIHIVPSVDDGARTIEEALEMLHMEARQGVDFIFATPHSSAFDDDPARVQRKYEELEYAINEAEIEKIQLMGLVKFGLVDYMGSDAHRLAHRPPAVEDGVKRILDLTSHEQAEEILCVGPKCRILRGQ